MTAVVAELPVLTPGDLIAPGYRVIELLSRGSALDVYEVWSEERLCSCVAKTVRPDRAHVQRVRDRLLLEGRLLTELAHPHLPRAFETVALPVPVVVVETSVGLTLEEIIDLRLRRLPLADLCHLGRQLSSAIHYLHGHGFLHLDIRPANVMAHGGVATLIDLSIASPPGRVRRGLGTQEYLAPEQALGGDVTSATDVWGLGATLYEAATGVAPFAPYDRAEEGLFASGEFLQLRRGPSPPSALGRRLPRPFVRLLDDCLTPEPEQRPQALEVHRALGELLEGGGPPPVKPQCGDQ